MPKMVKQLAQDDASLSVESRFLGVIHLAPEPLQTTQLNLWSNC